MTTAQIAVERIEHPQWLSNTYLIKDPGQKRAAMVDGGGPIAELLNQIQSEQLDLTHILLTHHHYDHIAELEQAVEFAPQAKVLIHPLGAQGVLQQAAAQLEPIEAEESITTGDLTFKAIPTPGHSAGMLNFLLNDSYLFTGDTLFKGSVGGIHAPGHTTYDDLKRSIIDRIMTLDPKTKIMPGHTESTTVGAEWEQNPFIRIWRGLDPEGDRSCLVRGQKARLILHARDYDGGYKAWVRWPDGRDDIVPGSQVEL